MATLEAKSIARREDERLLTGRGNYAADQRRNDMLHAVLVRSPHAHARFGRPDTGAAHAVPGVVGVFTYEDLTDIGPIPGGIGFRAPMAVRRQRPTAPCSRAIVFGSSASQWRWSLPRRLRLRTRRPKPFSLITASSRSWRIP